MLEKLRVNVIYDDFIKNVNLTDEQIEILNMLLDKEKTIKIADELGMSERTVSYEIKKIKDLYKDYYNMQLVKMFTLID